MNDIAAEWVSAVRRCVPNPDVFPFPLAIQIAQASDHIGEIRNPDLEKFGNGAWVNPGRASHALRTLVDSDLLAIDSDTGRWYLVTPERHSWPHSFEWLAAVADSTEVQSIRQAAAVLVDIARPDGMTYAGRNYAKRLTGFGGNAMGRAWKHLQGAGLLQPIDNGVQRLTLPPSQ